VSSTRLRRIAVVLPVELRADALHRDLLPTAYGLAELGHDVSVYSESATVDIPGLRHVVAGGSLTDRGFWTAEAPEWALVLTWLTRADVLEAIAACGALVVSKGDTDGLVSSRQHPVENWQRMVLHKQGTDQRVRASWHFLKRLVALDVAERREIARSLRASDGLVVESSVARRELARFLRTEADTSVLNKIHVQWNPVQDWFSRGPVRDERERLVVAVGRWDDPQKDAPLLRAGLERMLATDDQVRVEIAGPLHKEFRGLDPSRVTSLGPVPNTDLPDLFGRARIIAFASRWEGMPIAALEALSCGCSVVATDVPAFLEIAAAGGGRLARNRRPAALAQALLEELSAWDEGLRSATRVAEVWRGRVDRKEVARQYVDLFGEAARANPGPNGGRALKPYAAGPDAVAR
jgi:hypothetical protein